MWRVLIVVLFALPSLGAQWLITSEGGTNNKALSTTSLAAGTRGPNTFFWSIFGTPAGTNLTSDFKILDGPVYLTNGFGLYYGQTNMSLMFPDPTGNNDGLGVYFYPAGDSVNTTNHCALAQTWIMIKWNPDHYANRDLFTCASYGGDFVNANMNNADALADPTHKVQIQMETFGTVINLNTIDYTNAIHIFTNTWYRLCILYHAPGTGGYVTNYIAAYDEAGNLVDRIVSYQNTGTANFYGYQLIGITDHGNPTNHPDINRVFFGPMLIETTDNPQWPPFFGSLPPVPGGWPMPATNKPPNGWNLGVNVGVEGGIPPGVVFTNLTSADLAVNPASVINHCISVCPSNGVVVITNGTFTCEAAVAFPDATKGVCLRGASNDTTVLVPPSGLSGSPFIYIGVNGGNTQLTNITSGWSYGSSNISVQYAGDLAVGNLVQLFQTVDPNKMWQSSALRDTNGSGLFGQMAKVTAISGSNITIWPPIMSDLVGYWSAPRIRNWGGHQVVRCGIENLVLDNSSQQVGYGWEMEQAINCWAYRVRTVNVKSYHAYLVHALFCEIPKPYIDRTFGGDYTQNHGGILFGNGAADTNSGSAMVTGSAIYNGVFYKTLPGVQVNGGSCGNVISYSYYRDIQFLNTAQSIAINMNHGGSEYMNLVEGNYCNQIDTDGNFGGNFSDLVYRNFSTGWTETYTNYNSRPISLARWAIQNFVVGNIFGHPAVVPASFTSTNTSLDIGTPVIQIAGYPNGTGNASWSGGPRPPFVDRANNFDMNVTNSTTFQGNWDSFHNAQVWNYAIHSLSNSMYLASAPSWFVVTWPPFDPSTGTNNIATNMLPAQIRYYSGNWPDEVGSPPVLSSSSAMVGSGASVGGGGRIGQ